MPLLAALTLALALAVLTAWDGVATMVGHWQRDEYSYGYVVPFLVAFFVWQKASVLASLELRPTWWGMVVTTIGTLLVVTGELATLYVIVQFGFIIVLHGIALTALGWRGYRVIAVPLSFLFFVVPLPGFLYNNLSLSLQLISSEIGVEIVRLFGISVHLEGNVIHLANMNLHVAEACSGLRYLFPLMAVGIMVAYVYRAPFWKRAVVFLSTIPITVLINSVRIGLIGVSVEYWGPGMTEGILHDFEGWVIFMGSVGLLLLEMWLLNGIGGQRASFGDTFYIELPRPLPAGERLSLPAVSTPLVGVVLCLSCGALLMNTVPQRDEIVPPRVTFNQFPDRLGDWIGNPDRLDPIYVEALKFDDYLLADFHRSVGGSVNLYLAYYGSQRKGASVHSPRSCIPGDGWEIAGLERRDLAGVAVNGRPLRVNRVVIKKGNDLQLVYYWFQQRGRVLSNEYLVKWYLFRDALTRHRTDGGLVRLTTVVPSPGHFDEADARLSEFARLVATELEPFVPN